MTRIVRTPLPDGLNAVGRLERGEHVLYLSTSLVNPSTIDEAIHVMTAAAVDKGWTAVPLAPVLSDTAIQATLDRMATDAAARSKVRRRRHLSLVPSLVIFVTCLLGGVLIADGGASPATVRAGTAHATTVRLEPHKLFRHNGPAPRLTRV